LLPHVDVMVTNGGYNGVQMALSNAIPLVVAGQTEEKPEVAARVEWNKLGIDLKTRTPSPEQIRKAVKMLLTDMSYRTRAKEFQTKMQQYNAPVTAATLIEQLATTKQPVLR
jgi:UDP:flavonoid glycosyltransferase YjiC (YdhE family)